MGKIIQALSALLEASYFEGVSLALFERWRELAADARAEYDALRARLDEAERLAIKTPHHCAGRGLCSHGDHAPTAAGEAKSEEDDGTPAPIRSALDAMAGKPEPLRCHNTACRFYGQLHATPHEAPDGPEPKREVEDIYDIAHRVAAENGMKFVPTRGHAYSRKAGFPVYDDLNCAVCGLPPSRHK